jgi:hypothetical protein
MDSVVKLLEQIREVVAVEPRSGVAFLSMRRRTEKEAHASKAARIASAESSLANFQALILTCFLNLFQD